MKQFFQKTYHRFLLEQKLWNARELVNGRILDVGSKNRRYDAWFSGNITAVDIAPNQARNIIFGDVAKGLQFADNSFDAIVCIEVLEYLQNPDKAVREMHRLLAPGKIAIITMPFMYHDHDDVTRLTVAECTRLFSVFSSARVETFGNGWVVAWDILRKKMLASRNPFLWLWCAPALLISLVVLRVFGLAKVSDKFYSGIFAVVEK